MPHRKLKEIVAGQDLLSAALGDTVAATVRRMQARRFSCVPVIEDDRLLGIFTSTSLVRNVLDAELDPATTLVGDVMTPNPYCLDCGCQGIEAVNLMKDRGVRHVIVIGNGGPVAGIVTVDDFPASEIAEIEDELAFERRLWEEL